jgi:hypothetical protein
LLEPRAILPVPRVTDMDRSIGYTLAFAEELP